jgi:antitoxin ParD1/3/4
VAEVPGDDSHAVDSGLYVSAGEVVREALRLLEERDRFDEIKFEELRVEIQVGLDQVDRGELLEGPEVIETLRSKVRAKRSERRA